MPEPILVQKYRRSQRINHAMEESLQYKKTT
jgi:hypothetical protein